MKRLGLSIASYRRYKSPIRSGAYPGWEDALELLDHCGSLGAGCLQIGVGGWSKAFARQVREKCEALEMVLEGQIRLPRDDGETVRFQKECEIARDAGATILRTVCLGGRRYEAFDSESEWRTFCTQSRHSLILAEPVMRKQGLKLAVENHKDWRAEEFLALLKEFESEAIGATFDFGNNLSLLEDPHALCNALAPYILTTHVKDMGLRPYEGGFLLSEVPLGQGILDLPGLIKTCERKNPSVQLNLEMITRDPLKVPYFSEKYWATMKTVPASDLATILRLLGEKSSKTLPTIAEKSAEQRLAFEEENVRKCFRYAREHLIL